MSDVTTQALVVVLAAAVLGAFVQSVVGIGLGLIAAPAMTLVAPDLMPGAMLLVVVVLPLITLAREHDDIDWRGLGWTMPARVVGTVVGVWLVSAVDERGLGLLVGVMVLAAVLLTWRAVVVPITRGTLLGAGFIGGITGTTSSIGGPPLAILYQRRPPRQIRTTLAVFFLLGSLISLTGLAIGGELTRAQWHVALLMIPAILVGNLLSTLLKDRLSAAAIRPLVLLVCGASALALIVRSLG